MTQTEKVLQTILQAVDELNQQLPPEQQLDRDRETVLFGREGKLDSLGLVNLVIATEEYLEEAFCMPINISQEETLFQKDSPLETIQSFADYITAVIEGKQRESNSL